VVARREGGGSPKNKGGYHLEVCCSRFVFTVQESQEMWPRMLAMRGCVIKKRNYPSTLMLNNPAKVIQVVDKMIPLSLPSH
jgi:hypothetical protein